jgi:hypothetical protein
VSSPPAVLVQIPGDGMELVQRPRRPDQDSRRSWSRAPPAGRGRSSSGGGGPSRRGGGPSRSGGEVELPRRPSPHRPPRPSSLPGGGWGSCADWYPRAGGAETDWTRPAPPPPPESTLVPSSASGRQLAVVVILIYRTSSPCPSSPGASACRQQLQVIFSYAHSMFIRQE